MIKPAKTLVFLLSVLAIIVLAMFFLSDINLKIGGYKLKIPEFYSFFGNDTIEYADISDIVNNAELVDIDSLQNNTDTSFISLSADSVVEVIDTLSLDTVIVLNVDSLKKMVHAIEYPANTVAAGNKECLDDFYGALYHEKWKRNIVRVMHFGDSQIECDRITSFIRNKLQHRFKGLGPGLLPAIQPYGNFFSINQTNTGNWQRYTIFGKLDTNIVHKNYGAMAAFSRYAPVMNDSVCDSVLYSAGIKFSASKTSYRRARKFSEMKLFYGNLHYQAQMNVLINDSIIQTVSLITDSAFCVYTFKSDTLIDNVEIEFFGYDSPDIYGLSLNDTIGLTVDNIALRGSSGTIFTKLDYSHLDLMLDELNPKLVILQFGGNVMPYIKMGKVKSFGYYFGRQLKRLKKMRPNSSFIVIGPSDMSVKDDNNYLTYPVLASVNNVMKKASFDAGFAYWDMYKAMGGKNSMPSWVNADPPLASKDYTHFTIKGAKLVANMFYNALMVDYEEYKKKMRKNE